jgi:DNA-binding response OmpR family regulator
MLTAKTDPADLLVAIESGADDYVTKPLKSAELRARLRAACRILELQQFADVSNQAPQSPVYAEWG